MWREEAVVLKEKLKEMLHNVFTTKGIAEQLKLIDTIQRLGIAYHFEEEIQVALNQIYDHDLDELHDHDDDDNPLLISTLRFRLLREHGYKVSCGSLPYLFLFETATTYNNAKGGKIISLLHSISLIWSLGLLGLLLF